MSRRFNASLDVKVEHTRLDIEMLWRIGADTPFVAELETELLGFRIQRLEKA